MLLNRISLRMATAAGSATLVAGAAFAVSAFADSGPPPERAATAATAPKPSDEAAETPFWPEEPEDAEAEGEDARKQAKQRREDALGAAVALGSATVEQEKEEEEEEEPASDVPAGSPKEIAQTMLGDYGWESAQFDCLEPLWEKESEWDHTARNPSSGAYGIPQALPGSKMASAGDDWETNPATQIEWGLGYIEDRYGSPCEAWNHSQANNWY